MTDPDPESQDIQRLAELNRELYLLETAPEGGVFPMWGASAAGQNLERIYQLKIQITDLEEKLATASH